MASREPDRNDLTEIQRKALDAIVDYHVSRGANGTPIGHVVLQGPDEEAADYRVAAMWLARSGLVEAGGIAPNYTLHPTWLGLLLSSKAEIVALVAEKLLVFFKNRIRSQGIDFKKYTLDEMVAERVVGKPDALFLLHTVIRAFDLASDSSTSAGPPPTANWSVPRDIVDFRAFKGMRALQIRMQRPPPSGLAVARSKKADQPAEKRMPTHPRDVFVVHGRDRTVREALFDFLGSVGLNPLEWEEARALTGKTSPYIGEILDAAFERAQAIVVALSGDDEARLRSDLHGPHEPPHETTLTRQARANVIFEAGIAMGRDPNRTILVEFGSLRPFSDIAGRHTVRMTSGSAGERQTLVARLRTAGCELKTDGKTDWLDRTFFASVFHP